MTGKQNKSLIKCNNQKLFNESLDKTLEKFDQYILDPNKIFEYLYNNQTKILIKKIQNNKISKEKTADIKKIKNIIESNSDLGAFSKWFKEVDTKCMILKKAKGNFSKDELIICFDSDNDSIKDIINQFTLIFNNEYKILEEKFKKLKKIKQDAKKKEHEFEMQVMKLKELNALNFQKGFYLINALASPFNLKYKFTNEFEFEKFSQTCSGFWGGSLVTIVSNSETPISNFMLKLYLEFNLMKPNENDNIIYINSSSSEEIIQRSYQKISSYVPNVDEIHNFSKNIFSNITEYSQIEHIVIKNKPRIIFIDTLPSLVGDQSQIVDNLYSLSRKYKVLMFLLIETNITDPKLTNIAPGTTLIEKSNKVISVYNTELKWYKTIDSKKYDLFPYMFKILKNKNESIGYEYLFYAPTLLLVESTNDKEKKRIDQDIEKIKWQKEEINDSDDGSDEIDELQRQIKKLKDDASSPKTIISGGHVGWYDPETGLLFGGHKK